MYDINVCLSRDETSILDSFKEDIIELKNKGLNIDTKNVEIGDMIMFDLCLKDKDKNKADILKQYLANSLADIIIKHGEVKLLDKIIQKNANYFSTEERFKILKNVYNILSQEKADFFWIRKKEQIINTLIDFMNTSNMINLDGFIKFRLQDYIKDLNEVVNKAIDDYMVEKEYDDFIKLLKYFVDIQDSKFNIIHVLVDEHMNYTMLDENKNIVKDDLIEVSGNLEEDFKNEDLLVSSLISLSPQKIFFHCPSSLLNSNLLNTLKNVFGNKLTISDDFDSMQANFFYKK